MAIRRKLHGYFLFLMAIRKITKDVTSDGLIVDLTCDEIGKMLSSSSMTKHALHDVSDNRNRSLNRETISECDSVLYLS